MKNSVSTHRVHRSIASYDMGYVSAVAVVVVVVVVVVVRRRELNQKSVGFRGKTYRGLYT